MKRLIRMLSAGLAAALCLLPAACALAKTSATPSPAPQVIETSVCTPPAEIRSALDIAYTEWETVQGKKLSKCNKYTEWRGKGVKFEWCGGFVTWCMMQAGIDMIDPADVVSGAVGGVLHIKTANVGKMLTGYTAMERTTLIPQPGFLIVYGYTYHRYYHVGLVYDVQDLGNGKYRITTIEGNISNTVRMYVHDYDSTANNYTGNLTEVPEAERTRAESKDFSYSVQKTGGTSWYANMFLMTWIPGEEEETAPEAIPTP